jgi:hypothetical protein
MQNRKRFLAGVLLLLCAAPTVWGYTFLNVADRRDYAFDRNGILYITAGSGNVQRYNTSTSSFLTPFNIGGSPIGIDLSPDGSTLAVADGSTQGTNNRIQLVNTATGVATPVSFVRESLESGTYMTAWGSDGRLLVTSNFAGSGWVPLRRYNPQTGTTTTVASVRQSSMLTPSADRNTIGIAEANTSNGPVTAYNVNSGTYSGTVETNWFTFEVGVSRDGSKWAVPTYDGTFVYNKAGNTFQLQGMLGQYADHGPLAAVFSPNNDVLFTADWSFSSNGQAGVRVINANTLGLITTLDPYPFGWNGNGAMGSGRLEISPDGHWLAVSVDNGVRLYDVSTFTPEPTASMVAAASAISVLRRRRR